MRKLSTQTALLAWTLVVAATLVLIGPVSNCAGANQTLDNLMTAYNGESNAHAKYLAYAEKADAEGYGKVASLFRATAKAEGIHMKNHAEVIRSLGGTPKADIELPEIKSTRANLEDALKGETYENTTMYKEFIDQAQKDGDMAAVRTFSFARSAEAEHAKLYQEALNNLAAWKGPKAEFYVCPTCGYTVEGKPAFTVCPVCGTAAKDYLMVS